MNDPTHYKIGTIAEKAGISANLLRAWEKRYKLFAPQRGGGGQRLYSQEDLQLLRHIKQKIDSGFRIGEIAAAGRKALLQEISFSANAAETFITQTLSSRNTPLAAKDYINLLIQGSAAIDADRIRRSLRRAKLELSLDTVVYKVLIPAMEEVGRLYLDHEINIAGEHLVSNMIEQFMHTAIDEAVATHASPDTQAEICACFPEENHRIGLLAVAYSLARHGRNIIVLGASMPMDSLQQSIKQIHPARVWLSVTSKALFQRHRTALAELAASNDARFIIGGKGAPETDRLLEQAGCRLHTSPGFLVDTINSIQ